jgi:hypothetical protein
MGDKLNLLVFDSCCKNRPEKKHFTWTKKHLISKRDVKVRSKGRNDKILEEGNHN